MKLEIDYFNFPSSTFHSKKIQYHWKTETLKLEKHSSKIIQV